MTEETPSVAVAVLQRRLQELWLDYARQLYRGPLAENARFERSIDDRGWYLATVQAATELLGEIRSHVDFAMGMSVRWGATYAELGAVLGTTRQAARKRYHAWKTADDAEQAARRAESDRRRQERPYADPADTDWPPRAWRFRAPAGQRTVLLVGGPVDGVTYRVPAGDDAFVELGRTVVFGTNYLKYARYQPESPDTERYGFTGEFYLRR